MSARKKQPQKRTKGTGKRVQRRPASERKKSARQPARAAKPSKASKESSKSAKAAAAKKQAAKQALKAKLAREREKEQQAKAREKERAQREKEKARVQKERERERANLERQREKEKADREREKQKVARQREQAQKLKEREQQKAQREKAKAREQKERERLKAEREKEKARQKAFEAAEKARKKKEAEEQKAREKAEREAEKRRLAAEREAEKEAARKAKEEERTRREAEREAYRKAKEAERERLRAEREAARRLRESKVARATRAAQRVDGLRMGSARVYDPSAIPNQSGTTRHTGPSMPMVHRLVGVRPVEPVIRPAEPPSAPAPAPVDAAAEPSAASEAQPPVPSSATGERRPTPPPAAPLPPVAEGIEERYRRILERLTTAPEALRKEYEETLEMSWIHHDSALEGVVYTFQELRAAMDTNAGASLDSSLQPVCEEIRRHRQAIAYVRDLGERKRVPLNVDVVKKLFVILHPEEGDVKTVKYRKDIPQHRLYFHEYAAPDKIAYRVRQIMDWLNGPEAKKMKNPLRVGARVHYDLLRVFPFAQDSGKVARLIMNIVLLRGGYPPAIVHSTERQRYYEALKGQLPVIIQLVNESILNALASIEKRLDDEARAAS